MGRVGTSKNIENATVSVALGRQVGPGTTVSGALGHQVGPGLGGKAGWAGKAGVEGVLKGPFPIS